MSQVRAEVRIQGQVQGVSFRHYTRQTAQRHDVTGWVKNLSDGDVAAVFEGSKENVEQVVEWCRSGPSSARVENVDVAMKEFKGEFSSFDIRH